MKIFEGKNVPIITLIREKLDKVKGICRHRNKRYRKWVFNKTPMVEVQCTDCLKILDYGHVYGGIENWETEGWIRCDEKG